MDEKPFILAETEDFAVVYKPPCMHCAPLSREKITSNNSGTLLDWYAEIFPPVAGLSGRKEREGGLLYRLDFETQGLVLFAKNQQSLDNLINQQNDGNFIKEYNVVSAIKTADTTPIGDIKTSPISGICKIISPPSAVASSFPPPPFDAVKNGFPQTPFVIESYFRPFGPGRKQVRPVTEKDSKKRITSAAKDRGGFYRTEIINVESREGFHFLTVRLKRGFRHQIRCHLAWAGCPVLNDPIYGNGSADGFLALMADRLSFADPKSGEPVEFHTAMCGDYSLLHF
jgi:23S rRNA pseudouridine1911/1915/1917 synthase